MSLLDGAAELGLWACLALLAYIYVGYPLTVMALPGRCLRLRRRAARPGVTVIIAAHNEAPHIAATVRNKLEQSYPAEHLDVIVVSDGSSDGTDAAVQALQSDRVR